MLSRVAEAIYWMSRYIERAENAARFVQVNQQLTLDMPSRVSEQWDPLIYVSGDQEAFFKRYEKSTKQNVVNFLTFDTQNPNSIRSCLRSARENARSVREVISPEMWEHINKYYLTVEAAATRGAENIASATMYSHEFFSDVKFSSMTFNGVMDATWTHDEGWHFSQLGQMIERADKTSRILDVKYFILLPRLADVGTPFDNIHWAALLRSASALEMYRRRFGRIVPNRVVEFLLLSREFPRSVSYCLTRANESLHAIAHSPLGQYGNVAERKLGALRSSLAYSEVQDIIQGGLHEFIDSFQIQLNDIGKLVYETFFAPRAIVSRYG